MRTLKESLDFHCFPLSGRFTDLIYIEKIEFMSYIVCPNFFIII